MQHNKNIFILCSPSMKIAMLSEGWEPLIGGGQLYAKYLTEYLVRDYNCHVDVFTRAFIDDGKKIDHHETLLWGKRRIRRVGPAGSFFSMPYRIINLITTTIFLYKKAKKEKYDLIHAHALLAGIPARIVGKLLHIPVVYTVHGTMHMDIQKKNFNYYMEKLLVTKIAYDLEISVSHNAFRGPVKAKKTQVIYPAIDGQRFEKVPPQEKHPGKTMLFVGRFDWQKGLPFLMEALSLIDKEYLRKHHFHLNMVGDGVDRKSIEQLVKKLDRDEFVTFLGKRQFDDTAKEYKKTHLFILPSLAEWQPVVVFEAFINKLPVIVTDVGDNKYFINDDNGIIVPSGDAMVLKRAIEEMLEKDDAELERLGENWYKLVTENLTWEHIIKQIYAAYENLLIDYKNK